MSKLSFNVVNEPERIAELANFAEGIFRDYFITLHDQDKVDYLVNHLLSAGTLITAIADEGYEYYFVDDEHGHVGFVGLKAYEDYLYLSKLYLAKEARNRGYGREEFEFVKQRAVDLGLPLIRLNVARENEAVWRKYQHMGFEIVEEADNDVGGGFQMNDYVMECKL